jgi:hypothetical protein
MSLPIITTRYPTDGEMNYVGMVAHVTPTVDIRLRFYKSGTSYILMSAEQYHRALSATFHADIATTSRAIIAYAAGYGDELSQFSGQTQLDLAKVSVLTRPESVATWGPHVQRMHAAEVYAFAKQYMPSIADHFATKTERRFHFKASSPTVHTIEIDVTRHGDKATAVARLREVSTPMSVADLALCQSAIEIAVICVQGANISQYILQLRGGATYDEAELVYIAAFVRSPHLDAIRAACRGGVDQSTVQAMLNHA